MEDMIGYYGRQAVDIYENQGKKGLSDFLANLDRTRFVQGYLLYNKKDILGRELPSDIVEMLSHLDDMDEMSFPPMPDTFPSRDEEDREPPPDEMGDLFFPPNMDEPMPPKEMLGGPPPPPMGIIRPIIGAEGQHYYFLVKRPPNPMQTLFERPISLVVRVMAILLMAGLVCYGLASYLTSPLRKLQFAARRFGNADFAFRIGRTIGNRHDEIGDLGRDFDFMAERIEALILGQKRLLRDISHELRSPLARLTVAVELARKRAGSEAAGALDRIDLEVTRINDMIGRLITLVRLENGPDAILKTEISLAEVLRDITQDADFEAHSSNRKVTLYDCVDSSIIGSPELIRSAIENIIRNALRYTKENTAVEISLIRETKSGEDVAVLRVRDHGCGIPEADLEKIFQPFYRVADSRDRQSGGVGLGLAITERAVKLHGGTIEVANVPDGGLAVTIYLPVISSSKDPGETKQNDSNEK
jgi:two-component system sensor histidine kinase CpxA